MSTRRPAPQPGEPSQPPGSPRPGHGAHAGARWLVLPAALGADASLIYVSRSLGAIVTLIEVAGTTVVALVLLAAIFCGSHETCERAFRLLRWTADRPEPPQNPAE